MPRRGYRWWSWNSPYSGDDDYYDDDDSGDEEEYGTSCQYCKKLSFKPPSGPPKCCVYSEQSFFTDPSRNASEFDQYFRWQDSDEEPDEYWGSGSSEFDAEESDEDASADDSDVSPFIFAEGDSDEEALERERQLWDRRYVHEKEVECVGARDLSRDDGDRDDDDSGGGGGDYVRESKRDEANDTDTTEGSGDGSDGSFDGNGTDSDSNDVDNSDDTDADNNNNRDKRDSSYVRRVSRGLSLLYRHPSRRRCRRKVTYDGYGTGAGVSVGVGVGVDSDAGADCTASEDEGYDMRDVDDSGDDDAHDHYSNMPANHVGRGSRGWSSEDDCETDAYRGEGEEGDEDSEYGYRYRYGTTYRENEGECSAVLGDKHSLTVIADGEDGKREKAKIGKKARARSQKSPWTGSMLPVRERLGGVSDGGVREYREGPHLQCMRCGAQHEVEGGGGDEAWWWCCGGAEGADGGLCVAVEGDCVGGEEVEKVEEVGEVEEACMGEDSDEDAWGSASVGIWCGGCGAWWVCTSEDKAMGCRCACRGGYEADAGADYAKTDVGGERERSNGYDGENVGYGYGYGYGYWYGYRYRVGWSEDANHYADSVDGGDVDVEEREEKDRGREWGRWRGRNWENRNTHREKDYFPYPADTRRREHGLREYGDSQQQEYRDRLTHAPPRESWWRINDTSSRPEYRRGEYHDYPRQESRGREFERRKYEYREDEHRVYGNSQRREDNHREHRSQEYDSFHSGEYKNRNYDYSHHREYINRENDYFRSRKARDTHRNYDGVSSHRENRPQEYRNSERRENDYSHTRNYKHSERQYEHSHPECERRRYRDRETDRWENDDWEFYRRGYDNSNRREYRGRSHERRASSRDNYRDYSRREHTRQEYRSSSHGMHAHRATSEHSRKIERDPHTRDVLPRDRSPYTPRHRSARPRSVSPHRARQRGMSRRSVSPPVRRNDWTRHHPRTRCASPHRGGGDQRHADRDGNRDGNRDSRRDGNRDGSSDGWRDTDTYRDGTGAGATHRRGITPGHTHREEWAGWGRGQAVGEDYRRWGSNWSTRWEEEGRSRDGGVGRGEVPIAEGALMTVRGTDERYRRVDERYGYVDARGGQWQLGQERAREQLGQEVEEEKDVAFGLSYGGAEAGLHREMATEVEMEASRPFRNVKAREEERLQMARRTEEEEKTGRRDDRVEYSGQRRRKRVDEEGYGREKQMRKDIEKRQEDGARRDERDGERKRARNADDIVQAEGNVSICDREEGNITSEDLFCIG